MERRLGLSEFETDGTDTEKARDAKYSLRFYFLSTFSSVFLQVVDNVCIAVKKYMRKSVIFHSDHGTFPKYVSLRVFKTSNCIFLNRQFLQYIQVSSR